MWELGWPGAVRFLDDLLALVPVLDRDGHVEALVRRHALLRRWDELTAAHPVVPAPVTTGGTTAVGHELAGVDAGQGLWRSHAHLAPGPAPHPGGP